MPEIYSKKFEQNCSVIEYERGEKVARIATTLDLPLSTGLIAQYATVHDLVELKTGDVPTLLFTTDRQLQKELNEQAALRALLNELPPYTAQTLSRYEAQVDPEARFVRYIDKLLPIIVDVIGCGARVMAEDYGITTAEALQQCHADLLQRITETFGDEFPTLSVAHSLLTELFESTFCSNQVIGL